jgi:hypothetical protein
VRLAGKADGQIGISESIGCLEDFAESIGPATTKILLLKQYILQNRFSSAGKEN